MRPEHRRTLARLRDFFLARSGRELASAWSAMAEELPGQRPGNTNGDDLEFAFNRLFVGPMALEAPPYASIYLSSEPRLMDDTTLKVRRIYEMAGLISPLQGQLPDDHIGVELDAALTLSALAEDVDAQEPRALWHYFLYDHLQRWLPGFIDKTRRAQAGHPAVDLALDHLETWLDTIKEEGKAQ